MRTSRELYERQVSIEEQKIAEVPAEEEEELALIYEAKGLPEDQALTYVLGSILGTSVGG